MLKFFVQGVADTYRLWDDVRSQRNGVESMGLALPGFNVDVPQGFRADKEAQNAHYPWRVLS